MLKRLSTHCFDETCASCMVADNFIFLAHHAGEMDKRDITQQMRAVFERMKATLAAAGAELSDMIQLNLYLRDMADFEAAIGMFEEYFIPCCFPARITLASDFIAAECLCQMNGVACKLSISPQPFSAADELLKWKRLLDEGAISPEEFDAQKRKPLAL